jgi:hypothetical protein
MAVRPKFLKRMRGHLILDDEVPRILKLEHHVAEIRSNVDVQSVSSIVRLHDVARSCLLSTGGPAGP